jgi:hypothetical protein
VPAQRGASPVHCHDGVLLEEWHRIAPVGPFIKLGAPSEGPQGHEASHHAAVLKLVPDGVCMVWTGLLKEPIEVICRWPYRVLVTVHGGRDASHIGASHLQVAAVITAGRGRGPLRALLAPLIAPLDALQGTVSSDIRHLLLVTARGHLPTCRCGVEHDHLVAGVLLGGDVARLLERAYKEVALSALPRALLVASGRRAWATLASLATNLRLITPSLSSSQRSLG